MYFFSPFSVHAAINPSLMPSSSRVTCSGVTLMSLRHVCQTFAHLKGGNAERYSSNRRIESPSVLNLTQNYVQTVKIKVRLKASNKR